MEHNVATAETLDISQYATQGFCQDFPLLRHREESLANAGCLEAREDWARYIGPSDKFGCCNPFDGNFAAMALPLCKPERLKLLAYILEYAFLLDDVVEAVESDTSTLGDGFSSDEHETAAKNARNVKNGRKQVQAKIMLQLNQTDKVCAERVMDTWKVMLSTALRDRGENFSNLKEYLEFRIIDSAGPWLGALALFGLGMTLTPEEDAMIADILWPLHASMGLANDYLSFDKEWEECQSKQDGSRPMNAVWFFMKWRGVDMDIAKRLVVETVNEYERQFLDLWEQFRNNSPHASPKLNLYLRARSCQASANVVWSLRSPRYSPEYWYDPNAGVEDWVTAQIRGGTPIDTVLRAVNEQEPQSQQRPRDSDIHSGPSQASSVSAASAREERRASKAALEIPQPMSEAILSLKQLKAPISYIRYMPSNEVRDTLADALNWWAGLDEDTLTRIKTVVDDLHTASLMFGDIEGGSELRQGYPATHSVFGIPQTINSACFTIVEAINKARELSDVAPNVLEIVFEQLRDMYTGKSHDLHWARYVSFPSVEEYIDMMSKKTGGLFRMLSRLMCSKLDTELASSIDKFIYQLGLYFHIRDNYIGLNPDQYDSQNGFCDGLDEGKLSYPLVHYFTTSSQAETLHVREILEQRREAGVKGGLGEPLKKLVLQRLHESGSMAHTRELLKWLEHRLEERIGELERMTGKENWVLRLCLSNLKV